MTWRSRLLLFVAVTVLPTILSAQEGGGSAGPTTRGNVVVDEERGEVHLAPLMPVAGIVRDTADGVALGDARIELLGGGAQYRVRSGADGHFRLGAVRAGRYTVRVTRIGYEPVVLDDIA